MVRAYSSSLFIYDSRQQLMMSEAKRLAQCDQPAEFELFADYTMGITIQSERTGDYAQFYVWDWVDEDGDISWFLTPTRSTIDKHQQLVGFEVMIQVDKNDTMIIPELWHKKGIGVQCPQCLNQGYTWVGTAFEGQLEQCIFCWQVPNSVFMLSGLK